MQAVLRRGGPEWTVAAAVLAVGAGVLTAFKPGIAAALILAAAAGVFFVLSPARAWWWLLLFALAGVLLLDYGFANVGLKVRGAALPLADILLVLLLIRILVERDPQLPRGLPVLFAAGFLSLAVLRLVADAPEWGNKALRDFTVAGEIGFFAVGYWALQRYGVERLVNALRWIFLACLAFFLLYPVREQLAEAGPVVGLQQPVPLLGHFQGSGPAGLAGLLFFAIVRPFGRASYFLAAGFLPVIALNQGRALYLALPLALAVAWLLAGGPRSPRVRKGLIATVAASVVAFVVLLPLAPEGRLGRATPDFYAQHAGTLLGQAGPMAGSLEHRQKWIEQIREKLGAKEGAWLVGLGLGPDLASGFSPGQVDVRKPHNDYLEMLARMGILGIGLFLGFIAASLSAIVKSVGRAGGLHARFLLWVTGLCVVYLLVAATQPLLAYPFGTIPLFVSLGAGFAVALSVRERQPRAGEA